jgi:ribosome-binding protein aMBF1 (putative translation factor)
MIGTVRTDGDGWRCEFCGKKAERLKHLDELGHDEWVCPECEQRIRERIRRKYIMAGEQTEPVE